MALKLYNTLTRTKDEFQPLNPKNVRMYVCGPTVYDFAHIGNARPVIVFDVLFRLLRHLYGAGQVTYVRNITDVDDKINARAAEEGISIRELTERTAKQYNEDVAALGCLPPTHEPRATEHIPHMIAMIERLIASGHAYPAEGHVLYAGKAVARRDDRRRPRRSRTVQEKRDGLRIVEGVQARRAVMAKPLEQRPPGLAYRMLGHERSAPGRDLRHSRRRHRPCLSPPRERNRPIRRRPSRPSVGARLDA
jgi:cysteinyl-tRNA synthetase